MPLYKTIWRGWKKFAHILGKINTKIILSVFFWLILGPIALIKKAFTIFPKKQKNTYWLDKKTTEQKLEDFYRPF